MQGTKLFVGNMSYSTGETDLRDLFAEHGTVQSVNIIHNKGFGFVEMSTPAEAEAAREALNLVSLDGRNINVNEAKPPRQKPRRNFGSF